LLQRRLRLDLDTATPRAHEPACLWVKTGQGNKEACVMQTNLLHPRRTRRERRGDADPAEGRYRWVVEVVRTHRLDRLADDRQAQWNVVADLIPKSEATLLHERALRAMERVIGGRWEPVDEFVPSRSRESRMVAAPYSRNEVIDTATALYKKVDGLAARLGAAEVSAATAARLSRGQGPTAIATAECRQVRADLARMVADLELLAAPRHETRTPVHEDTASAGAPVRADERSAATAGSHAA
jgi:hypothetical protein